MKIYSNRPFKRYARRDPPIWMQVNLKDGKCWCGRPKELWESKYQRKYCSSKHGHWFYWYISAYWASFREQIYLRDKGICQMCFKSAGEDYQCDHILAIILGGECFDEENVQTLCSPCHKIKTKEDAGKRAKLRKA